ncbi:MAG: DUF72 domain-containing protein [Planctomycetota bacterium]
MSTPRLHVGTSGFSYDEWRPTFYPADVKKAGMLSYYASQLPSVELNNTFYRMPKRETVAKWAEQVPESFRFAVKAPRRFTWSLKLVDCGADLSHLMEQLEPLGPRLGCVFFQVPKFVAFDASVLDGFLAELPADVRVALEFVHESWHVPEVADRVYGAGATIVASDRDDGEPPELDGAAPWTYLRLRRASYTDEDLAAWRARLAERDAFVFFKHEDTAAGPAMARRFMPL